MRNDNFPRDIPALLKDDGQPPLSGWYADPLSQTQKEQMLDLAQSRMQKRYQQGDSGFLPGIIEMIALFADGVDVHLQFQSLKAGQDSTESVALLQLVYGQLLMSRKLSSARDYLDKAFYAAASSLEPEAYFDVMKRHELLDWLQLTAEPAPAMSLADLLTEARVIRQLGNKSDKQKHLKNKHSDTLD